MTTPPAADRRPLLDWEAVAAILGTTPRHVRRLVNERRIAYVKVGRFVRFKAADVDAWIDDNRRSPIDDTRRTPW